MSPSIAPTLRWPVSPLMLTLPIFDLMATEVSAGARTSISTGFILGYLTAKLIVGPSDSSTAVIEYDEIARITTSRRGHELTLISPSAFSIVRWVALGAG